MANLADRPTQLEDILAIANAKNVRKLLTDDNFKIISVEPYSEPSEKYNTVAVIEVDLYPGVDDKLLTCARFATRRVPFTRLTIKNALKLANIELDKLGRLKVASVADVDSVLNELVEKVSIDPEEITFMSVNDKTAVIRAKKDSLGFTGSLTVTTESDAPVDEVRWLLATDNFDGSFLSKDAAGKEVIPEMIQNTTSYVHLNGATLTEKVKALVMVMPGAETQPPVEVTLLPGKVTVVPVTIGAVDVNLSVMVQLHDKEHTVTASIHNWNIYKGPVTAIVMNGPPAAPGGVDLQWGLNISNAQGQSCNILQRTVTVTPESAADFIKPYEYPNSSVTIKFKTVTVDTPVKIKVVGDGVVVEKDFIVKAST